MPRKVRFVILVVALAVAVAIFSFAPFIRTPHASAATFIPHTNSTFSLVNENAAKCIGIDSSGYAGDWYCTTNPDQTWHWGDNETFSPLINGNGQCLGVQNGSTAQGAFIKGGTCNGAADQLWTADMICVVNNNYFCLFNYNSGWVIGVQYGSPSNGAHLVQWINDGSPDQEWTYA